MAKRVLRGFSKPTPPKPAKADPVINEDGDEEWPEIVDPTPTPPKTLYDYLSAHNKAQQEAAKLPSTASEMQTFVADALAKQEAAQTKKLAEQAKNNPDPNSALNARIAQRSSAADELCRRHNNSRKHNEPVAPRRGNFPNGMTFLEAFVEWKEKLDVLRLAGQKATLANPTGRVLKAAPSPKYQTINEFSDDMAGLGSAVSNALLNASETLKASTAAQADKLRLRKKLLDYIAIYGIRNGQAFGRICAEFYPAAYMHFAESPGAIQSPYIPELKMAECLSFISKQPRSLFEGKTIPQFTQILRLVTEQKIEDGSI